MTRPDGVSGTQAYAALIVAMCIGLVLVAFGAWRQGIIVVGSSLVGGALIRAALPEPRAGLLRVRGRTFDVLWMLVLGSGLVTLAFAVPQG
ncbi:DUF3017 domain-containing protein [Mumia sp. Pv 4-285]|uniref:DUF3017 domain-containing protein n=1 Tax=Mumia qirimensis TaxID=3234852 RepID=UPI00351D3624